MKQHLKFKIHSTLVLALFPLYSCGVPNPVAKEQSSTVIRSQPWRDELQLTSNRIDNNFLGSFAIWKEGSDTTKISEVAALSEKSKIERDLYLKAYAPIPKLESNKDIKKKLLEEVKAQKQKNLSHFYVVQSSSLIKSSSEYIKNLLNPGSEKDFEVFCDVSLLEFGLSKFLLKNHFTETPAPLGICSDYYKNKHLFTSDSCKSSGNYFGCIWDGIFDTFTIREKSGKKIELTAKSKVEILDRIKTLGQEDKIKKVLVMKLGSLGEYKVTLDRPEAAGQKFDAISSKIGTLLKDSSVGEKIQVLKNERAHEGWYYSYNDAIFNFHLVESQLPVIPTEDLLVYQTSTPQIFGDVPHDEESDEKIKSINIDIDNIDKKITASLNESNIHFSNFTDKYDTTAADLIKSFGLGYALLSQVDFSISPSSNQDESIVKLRINSGLPLQGCYKISDGKSTPCANGDSLYVNFNKSGLLTIERVLINPELEGFTELPIRGAEADFQLIEAKSLANKILRLELYPRKFGENLGIVTGTIFIRDDKNNTLYQGSANLTAKLPTAKI